MNGGMSLTKLKRWPSLKRHFKDQWVFIFSNEWNAFWGQGGCGYVDKSKAGVFTFTEAFRISHHCGPEKGIEYIVAKPEYEI